MDMETHENSTRNNFRVDSNIVSVIIVSTMIITACFIQNNISAQPSDVVLPTASKLTSH